MQTFPMSGLVQPMIQGHKKNQARILGKKQGHSASPWSNRAFLPRPVTPSRICKNLVFRQISVELLLGQKDTMGSDPSLQNLRKKGRILS